jgi:hypothetical protein
MSPGRLRLDGTSCTCCSKRYNANIRELFKELGYLVDDESLIVEKCFAVTAKHNEILIEAGVKPKKNMRVDYCIPSKNLIFELNGGGNHYLRKHQVVDEWKKDICAENGYRIVYIKTKGQILEENYEQKVKDALEAATNKKKKKKKKKKKSYLRRLLPVTMFSTLMVMFLSVFRLLQVNGQFSPLTNMYTNTSAYTRCLQLHSEQLAHIVFFGVMFTK